MSYFQSRPLASLGFYAIPLLMCIVALDQFFPKGGANGFNSVIIAMEFLNSFQDLSILFGSLDSEQIRGLDIGNYIDFVFMSTYSSFFFLLFTRLKNLHQFEWAYVGKVLSVLVLVADVVENTQLLNLTTYYPLNGNEEVSNVISILTFATWTKWLSIAAILALTGAAFWEFYGFGAKVVSLILSIPIILGGLGLLKFDAASIEQFVLSIFITIALLVVSCFVLKPVKLRIKI